MTEYFIEKAGSSNFLGYAHNSTQTTAATTTSENPNPTPQRTQVSDTLPQNSTIVPSSAVFCEIVQTNYIESLTCFSMYMMTSPPGTAATAFLSFPNSLSRDNLVHAQEVFELVDLGNAESLFPQIAKIKNEIETHCDFLDGRNISTAIEVSSFLFVAQEKLGITYHYQGEVAKAYYYSHELDRILSKLGVAEEDACKAIALAGYCWVVGIASDKEIRNYQEEIFRFDTVTSQVFERARECRFFSQYLERALNLSQETFQLLCLDAEYETKVSRASRDADGEYSGHLDLSLCAFREYVDNKIGQTKYCAAVDALSELFESLPFVLSWNFTNKAHRDIGINLVTKYPDHDVCKVLKDFFVAAYCRYDNEECWVKGNEESGLCGEHEAEVELKKQRYLGRFSGLLQRT